MMMSQVAQALGATLHGDDVMMTGVSKDTRDIHAGDLYVALKGERFDGHQFVADASSSGAVGALVSEALSLDVPQVQVDDTRIALGKLAAHWRQIWGHQQFNGKLIGITGSNGKTSVKEMCGKILSDHAGASAVLSTKGNLNNDIGLPMTLLELTEQHQFAVIEMGANHVGEIDYLSEIAKPDVALVNNAGLAHLEGFGSLENIAKSKAEIYNGMSESGVAVINQDDAFASYWKDYCSNLKIISFSMQDESADIYARFIENNRYQIITDAEKADLTLSVPGKHNVMNALAAIAVTSSLGLSLQSIVSSLSAFENIQGRLSVKRSAVGYQLIDDTYNANPLSVTAAIDVLVSMHEQVRGDAVLVLGDMAELGEDAEKLHGEIGEKAKSAGIQVLYATGKLSESTIDAFGENGFYFKNKNELIKALNKNLTADEVVLVKGSRSAAMEEVVERILTHQKRPEKGGNRATQEKLPNNKRVN
ncbi:MAG: UDP-N-acetylmuramoyl-tripeptide--D-alanyl-D-alanine ligase [Gammaproteobacteria bacterium]|nr:MAG: UDP-N-acetylmuramoyl-tripeptide--D-alanyl-D-alanine ligase [Gammaproteobacteria bacterium]